jgi:hypothetical protein
VGFVDAEGCFMVRTLKSSTHKLGINIRLSFTINQHSRDGELIEGLVKYFGYGKYYTSLSLNKVEFRVSRKTEIAKIIQFFDKYPLVGAKLVDYADFKRAADIIKNKVHLTEQDIKEIIKIKAGMNKGRS